MKAHLQYLKYVLRHKWFVFLACLDLRVPLWIAIFHDWDKFMPDEWLPYVHTFYAPDGSKQYKESAVFARAWMLHQHRNKHHWQYWLLVAVRPTSLVFPLFQSNLMVWDRGDIEEIPVPIQFDNAHFRLLPNNTELELIPCPMPDVYRREMLADWRGAGRALGFPNTVEWYAKNRDKMKLHPDTRKWIEEQLHFEDFVEAVTNNMPIEEVQRQRAAHRAAKESV